MERPRIELPPALDHALKIRHTYRSGWEQWYLLTADEHWDSPECAVRLLIKHAKQAKERNALWISAGDWFDCMQARDDPRRDTDGARPEHVKANYLDELVSDSASDLAPYADLFAYIGRGNHDWNITRRYGTDLLQRFADELNRRRSPGLPAIHVAGYTGWISMMFAKQNAACRFSHAMKIEHGSGGGGKVTKGVIAAQRRTARTEGATWFVSGHIHEQWGMTHLIETLNSATKRVETRKVKHIQLGSYKLDFRTDGAPTWHTQRDGGPKPLGGAWLRLYSDTGNDVDWEVTDTAVDYENIGDYLRRSRVVVDRDIEVA